VTIGIVGASGEVGRTMIKVLEKMEVSIGELILLASSKSAGKELIYKDKRIKIQELTEDKMKEKYDYLLFSAGGDVSRKYASLAQEYGNTVIDNSSAFRMQKDIPLVVPEINASLLKGYTGIVANPNCSTIQMVLALNRIHENAGLKEVVVSTYQAVSGAGNKGISELQAQQSGDMEIKHFPDQILNNVIPKIGEYEPNGFTQEEMKMVNETRKIFNDSGIDVFATTVRVPVFYGHSESVFFRTEKEVQLSEIKKLIEMSENVVYSDEIITPLHIAQSDLTYVSRLRKAGPKEYMMWVVADNVRVGAATNAVRILLSHAQLNTGK